MKSCGDLGLTVSGAILTHGHFDHAMSGYLAKERGVKVYVPVGDEKCFTPTTTSPKNSA